MKRLSLILLTILLVFTFSFGEAFGATDEPKINATTGILIDAHSGEVLWQKNADVQMAPASMTKMMTAILTVENLKMDTVVKADEEMVNVDGNRIYMEKGEKFTVEQLLKAMLVGSENDCAVALAKTISGSVKDFSNLMNGKAKELGCKNTTFKNPNGLDKNGHVSTAYDMALIAAEVMKHDELRKIVKMKEYTVPETNKHWARPLDSTNRMLWDKTSTIKVDGEKRNPYYKYCIGVKTGFTDNAQACLASCASRDGTELIAVVMHTGDMDRFAESIEILEWGLKNYTACNVYDKGQAVGTVKVKGSEGGKAETESAYYAGGVIKPGEDEGAITAKVNYSKDLIAPMKKGDKVGTIQVSKNGEFMTECDVVLSRDVEEGLFSFIYNGHVAHPWELALFCIGVLIGLFAIVIIILRIHFKRKAKRRREALRRKREREAKYRNMN